MSVPPSSIVWGGRSRRLSSLDFGRYGPAIGRVLINQRVDRIVDVDQLGLANEDRVRAVGNGGGLLAENIDLRILEIADAFGREGPFAEAEARLRRQRPTERGRQCDLVPAQQVHAEP